MTVNSGRTHDHTPRKNDFAPPDKHPGYKIKIGTITRASTYKYYNEAERQAREAMLVCRPSDYERVSRKLKRLLIQTPNWKLLYRDDFRAGRLKELVVICQRDIRNSLEVLDE